jgi:hypothetical protein
VFGSLQDSPAFSSFTNKQLKTNLGFAVLHFVWLQVGGLRSNLWPGAVVVGKDKHAASMYVGWGIKHAPFVPLPPPEVAKEFDQALIESQELPPKPAPPPAEGEEEEN